MTREEAVQVLRDWDGYFIGHSSDDVNGALNMAIKALSSSEKPNKWIDAEVLDKIRAEIDEQYDRVHPYDISCAEGLEMALGIIDKYKAESEVQDD